MLASLPLLLLAQAAAPGPTDSILAAVPENAYTLLHCRDVADLRARAERNDWYRLLGSEHGEPILLQMLAEFSAGTHSDADRWLAIADELKGEVVLFDTGVVAGLVVERPADPAVLLGLLRGWMPAGDPAATRTITVAGGTVELFAWPDEIAGWDGRKGHFAAMIEHPGALAIYSGDSSPAVVEAVSDSFQRLGTERRSPLVDSYFAAGGGVGDGVEMFVDFTTLVDDAEAALKGAFEGILPDPSRLLGLERGTWLHASLNLFPGTRVECDARLHLPIETLAARLADTFQPLQHTLPSDLPTGVWGLWALHWDIKKFYKQARSAYEEAGRAEGLAMLDAGVEASKGAAGVDPIIDVLNQLAGTFAFYVVHPAQESNAAEAPEQVSATNEGSNGEMMALDLLGVLIGIVDTEVFLSAFESLISIGGLESGLDLEDIAGAEVYVSRESGSIDGGFAFLPGAFAIAPARRVLELAVRALVDEEGASLADGSRMQAVIDEHAGACYLMAVEMTPLRAIMLPGLGGDLRLPPIEEGQPARDPFDSQLVWSAERTRDGFKFRLGTR